MVLSPPGGRLPSSSAKLPRHGAPRPAKISTGGVRSPKCIFGISPGPGAASQPHCVHSLRTGRGTRVPNIVRVRRVRGAPPPGWVFSLGENQPTQPCPRGTGTPVGTPHAPLGGSVCAKNLQERTGGKEVVGGTRSVGGESLCGSPLESTPHISRLFPGIYSLSRTISSYGVDTWWAGCCCQWPTPTQFAPVVSPCERSYSRFRISTLGQKKGKSRVPDLDPYPEDARITRPTRCYCHA